MEFKRAKEIIQSTLRIHCILHLDIFQTKQSMKKSKKAKMMKNEKEEDLEAIIDPIINLQ